MKQLATEMKVERGILSWGILLLLSLPTTANQRRLRAYRIEGFSFIEVDKVFSQEYHNPHDDDP